MKQQNLQIAHDVAQKLLAAEEAIDAALNKSAELLAYVPLARLEANVSTEVGQDAIEHLVHSMSKLSEARRFMVEGHEALSRTQKAARLAPRNYGGFIDKPQQASLTVVKPARTAA